MQNRIKIGNTQFLIGAKIVSAYGKMPQYVGRVGIRENGKALYSFSLDVTRLSRGDALNDAASHVHDIVIRDLQK